MEINVVSVLIKNGRGAMGAHRRSTKSGVCVCECMHMHQTFPRGIMFMLYLKN